MVRLSANTPKAAGSNPLVCISCPMVRTMVRPWSVVHTIGWMVHGTWSTTSKGSSDHRLLVMEYDLAIALNLEVMQQVHKKTQAN